MASHAIILYIVLPSLAAGIAGYIWGGAILDSSHVKTYRQSVLRGLRVSAGAYAIFGLLYACELPLLEGEWSLGRAGSLFLFVLMLGPLMVAPMAAMTGMISGIAPGSAATSRLKVTSEGYKPNRLFSTICSVRSRPFV